MFLFWIYAVNIILIIAVVFFQRKEPAVAMAWVLCFIFMPVFGAVAYIIFGWGLKKRTKKKYLEKFKNSLEFSTNSIHAEGPEKFKNMIHYFKNVDYSVLTNNNSVKVYTNASDKYKDLLNDIANAKETVNLLYFIVHDDGIGSELLRLLEKKADEGVEIRFLYDGIGSLFMPHAAFR